MLKGKYIVIEGAQGVGKSTMVQLVAQQLRAAQLPVHILQEPDAQNDLTARAIRQLTQDPRYPMATRTEVLLYNAARSQSLEVIRQMAENGITCLVDRSYLTTLAIQYYGRGDVQDYQKINSIIDFAVGDTHPDLVVVLDAPVSALAERLRLRRPAEPAANLDEAFLERVRAGYLWEAKQRDLPVVYATDDVDTTFRNVWQHVAATMAVRDKGAMSQPQSVAEVLAANPPTKAAAVEPPITESMLQGAASASTPATEPAATDPGATTKPVVRTGNSDQQLDGQHIVVEGATQLTASAIAHGSRMAYCQVTPADSSQRDANGQYRYYTPGSLKGKLRSQYTQTMDQIFDTYAKLLNDATAYLRNTSATSKKDRNAAWRAATKAQALAAAQPVLPLANLTTMDIYASGLALESTIMHLLGEELPEAGVIGQHILSEARKATPLFLEPADNDDSAGSEDGATAAYRTNTRTAVKLLAGELLPAQHTAEASAASLTSYTPHNELDTVPDILYEHSDLPLETLQREVAAWPYQRKESVFRTYMGDRRDPRDRPGQALEKVHYSFDLVSDFSTFCELLGHIPTEALERQAISPRIGYGIPKLIEDAGLADVYERCFDLSLQLYSALQASGAEAQYAALLGHKLRWQVTYNAREAFRLHAQSVATSASPANPTQQTLLQQMHEKIAEVHPLLAEAMQPPHHI